MNCRYISQESNKFYSSEEDIWCGLNGELLDLEYHPKFQKSDIDYSYNGLWRYRKAIPISEQNNIISIGESITPIQKAILHGKEVWMKSEYMFPTGSYKDRGASVLISHLKEIGSQTVIEDSSGNAGSAIAAYAAKANLKCEIFMPESTSAGKVNQVKAYGATAQLIPGDRSAATDAALRALNKKSFASHVWNPFFFQGTKTFAYEIWEQMNGEIPDHIIFPTGNGTLLIGSYIGFQELKNNHLISKIPALHAAQAKNCFSLSDEKNTFQPTIAEGISVKNPARKSQIQSIITITGGTLISVSENEIIQSKMAAGGLGQYIESTSAVAIAALKKVDLKGKVLIPLTGTGLKQAF